MEIRKETKWLCENAHALERFSGKWVMFDVTGGVVKKDDSLMRLLRTTDRRAVERPYVLHVPSKKDLSVPLPGTRRR